MVSAVNARNFVIDPQRVKCREKICLACRPPFLIPPAWPKSLVAFCAVAEIT